MQRSTSLTFALALAACGAARAQQPAAPATPAANAAPAAQQPQQSDARPGIAVLDFDLGATMGANHETPQDYEALRRGLASLTITELTANPAIRVVERAQLQQILQEQNLGHEGRVDPSTLSRIGHLIGAKYMAYGTFYDLHGAVKVNFHVFDSETGEILKAADVNGRMDNLFDMVPRLAQEVIRNANLPPLERRAMEQFRQQNPAPPTQAVMAYSRAVLYADRGETARAVEQYNRAVQLFPAYTQAKTACAALHADGCTS